MYRFILVFTFCFFVNCIALELKAGIAAPAPSDKIYSPTECYTILQILGEGAFGKVYAVEDSNGQKFALKWFKEQQDVGIGWALLGDVEREFERGQIFDHPNIIRSHDLFHDPSERNYYLVLDLVEGLTVWETPRKVLSIQESLNATIQLTDALKYTLSMDFLYLDLHNGNLMLDKTSDLMIIDLASFFSWEELSLLFKKDRQQRSLDTDTMNARIDLQFALNRAKKLKQFLRENPQLLDKLHRAKQKKARSVISGDETQDRDFEQFKAFIFSMNFERITEVCIDIIGKSDLSKEEKIEMRVKIKKLAWNFSEDVQDGLISPSIKFYLDELVSILQSY